MKRRTLMTAFQCIVTIALLAGTTAEAGRRRVTLPVLATGLDNGAIASLAGPKLPNNASSPQFAVLFQLPGNYEKGSEIRVRLSVLSNTGATGCNYMFGSTTGLVMRPGKKVLGIPVNGGTWAPADGSPLVPGTGRILERKSFVLEPVGPGGDLRLAVGDTISLLFVRSATAAADTCNDELLVPAIEVVFRTN